MAYYLLNNGITNELNFSAFKCTFPLNKFILNSNSGVIKFITDEKYDSMLKTKEKIISLPYSYDEKRRVWLSKMCISAPHVITLYEDNYIALVVKLNENLVCKCNKVSCFTLELIIKFSGLYVSNNVGFERNFKWDDTFVPNGAGYTIPFEYAEFWWSNCNIDVKQKEINNILNSCLFTTYKNVNRTILGYKKAISILNS